MAENAFQDEADKTSIDQLHKAVLQLSSNCFETKKLCVTVLISAATLITTFKKGHFGAPIFLEGGVITCFFWLLDAQSYYYQEKLRSRMDTLAEDMANRSSPLMIYNSGVGMPLSKERRERKSLDRILKSTFNGSMSFYVILVLLFVIIGLLRYRHVL